MSCNHPVQPCPCVPYEDTGCLDTYNTDCVVYTGDPISCLHVAKGDTLTDIINHLKDVICPLAPTSWSAFDYGCFGTVDITTAQEFAEFISNVICEMLGAQTPGHVTSLSTLATNISTLNTQVNTLVNVDTLDCYETLTGLAGPKTNFATFVATVQQLLCTHNSLITGAVQAGAVALSVTDSTSIDFTANGSGNHNLTGVVKISAQSGNSISILGDGLFSQAVPLTVVDSPTIDLTSSGTLNHTLTAAAKISTNAGNALIAATDGLYVPAASFTETVLTVTDTSSLDLTAGGTNGHSISAIVKLDPDPTNIITVTSQGLKATVTNFTNIPITTSNTSTVNLTASGASNHTLQAAVKVSAASGNSITVNSDGIYTAAGNGKVKVDSADTLDYLENQIDGAADDDNFVTIQVTKVGGKLVITPVIDFAVVCNKLRGMGCIDAGESTSKAVSVRLSDSMGGVCELSPIVAYLASPNTAIATGLTVYQNIGLTVPFSGYDYIAGVSGVVYHINSTSGVVGAVAGVTC